MEDCKRYIYAFLANIYMKNILLILLLICSSVFVGAQAVYKTPSGAKYHLAECRMVKNVSKELSIAEAKQMGLEACKICKPVYKQPVSSFAVSKEKGEGKTVECAGLTKAGTRCKHKTKIANGYCFQHQPK
jgi:hypothetical protein